MVEDSGFINTNIFVNHIQGAHPEHSPAWSRLIIRFVAGEFSAWITETVVFETVSFLEQTLGFPRELITPVFTELLTLPNLHYRDEDLLPQTLDMRAEQPPLTFADCYHLLPTQHLGLTRIHTFDRTMDLLPGVARVEP